MDVIGMIRNDDDGGDEQGPQRVPDEGELAQLAEERNAAIRQYLRDQRSRLEIVATTRTPRGQVLDWVPAGSLAPGGVAADPPDEDGLDLRFLDEPADGEEVRPARLLSFELQEEGADRGPRGTVPVVRWDLDAITSTKTLQDFLSKHGRAARLRPDGFGDVALPEDATVHKYAYSAQWVTAYGGTQYIMSLKWQLWQGNWWLRCNGVWIGYYPANLFSTTGLRDQAEKVAWYGEIVDSGDHAGTTATDMGNGHWPHEGWQRCAYMSNLKYQSGIDGGMSRYAPTSVYATNSQCYDIEGHFDNTGSWEAYFWWGGSGRNSGCP